MRHRHLDYPSDTPIAELGPAALDDLLDRGDLDDWAPLLREIRRDPHGPVADRILRLGRDHALWDVEALARMDRDAARYLGRVRGPLAQGAPRHARAHAAAGRRAARRDAAGGVEARTARRRPALDAPLLRRGARRLPLGRRALRGWRRRAPALSPHGDCGSFFAPRLSTGLEGGGTTGPMSPSGASSRSTITGAWSLGPLPLRA